MEDIVDLLEGPMRYGDGSCVAWCHHCNLPIHEEHMIRTPLESAEGYKHPFLQDFGLEEGDPLCFIMCARCLKGPMDFPEFVFFEECDD